MIRPLSALARPLLALAVAAAILLAIPATALAHESRDVAGYRLRVGWLDEPAFAGQLNALELTITRGGQPVDGLAGALRAEILTGNVRRELTLLQAPGLPGVYYGDVIPTREGVYRFRISGAIEAQPIDETFESGPGRFEDVTSPAALQVPEPVPQGSALKAELDGLRSQATIGIVAGVAGAALGVGGVVLAIAALRRR